MNFPWLNLNFAAPQLVLAAMAFALAGQGVATAQLLGDKPPELQGVGVDEQLGKQIPLDLKFRDESGQIITLADIFNGERPVLLSLNYSNCPMLCGLQLNGLTSGLREIPWNAGEEFTVVSVSVDPLETITRAKQTKQKYLETYGRSGVGKGWRFLVGSQANITKLADAVGFRYRYVPETREYAHAAAEMVCTPQGVVSRYLYGVAFDPQTVRLSLVEAGEGKIGSTMDQLLLFCFHYDAEKGNYAPLARRLMQIGGMATLLAVVVGVTPYWRRSRKQIPHQVENSPVESPSH